MIAFHASMRTPVRFATLAVILTMSFRFACAEEPAAAVVPDPFESLLRLAGSMVIVVGLIVAAAYGARKLMARVRIAGPRRLMLVRQAINLGGKRQVYALEIGPSVLVIGAAGDQMRLLARLPKTDCEPEVGAGPSACPGRDTCDRSGRGSAPTPAEQDAPAATFDNLLNLAGGQTPGEEGAP